MRALVLADTHVGDDVSKVPTDVWRAAETADVILHAGDVVGDELLDRLSEYAPVYAVLGNNDRTLRRRLPETVEIDVDGVSIAMIHDSGPTNGRPRRMRSRFPAADLVVYGHSHVPDDSEGLDGQRLFNPGSCTQRRRAPTRTFGILEIGDGRLHRHHVVEVT